MGGGMGGELMEAFLSCTLRSTHEKSFDIRAIYHLVGVTIIPWVIWSYRERELAGQGYFPLDLPGVSTSSEALATYTQSQLCCHSLPVIKNAQQHPWSCAFSLGYSVCLTQSHLGRANAHVKHNAVLAKEMLVAYVEA